MLPRLVGLLASLLLLLVPASASAAPRVQHLKFKYGPVTIKPGQNTISLDGDDVPRPKRPGWIVGFRPNLERVNGKIPRVDVLHLHHAVWLINGQPDVRGRRGEDERQAAAGFGWRHEPDDRGCSTTWSTTCCPNRDRVYLTYTLDFIPDSSPAAKGMRQVKTRWLDVEGGKAYPVFDVHRGSGAQRALHLPRRRARRLRRRARAQPAGRSSATACWSQTAGHLHPGGLYTDLKLTRDGRTVNLFRSRAKYWEPAGAVSWDVAMTATRPNWRVKVKRGDVLSVSATYDSKRASWYESMGIMPVAFAPGAPRRRRPVLGQARAARPPHPRPPARRTTTTAASAAGCPTRARWPTAPASRRPARDHRLPLRPGRPAARRRRLAPARWSRRGRA